MKRDAAETLKEALALPTEARAALAGSLLDSLDTGVDEDAEAAWATEVNRIFSGEVALQGGLRELERLLNQDIDYGGGENPFKGIRWPIQPK